jgi:hypothetical protein
MVISSNTLFHFTKSMEDLVGILENCFIPRYCLENYSNLFHEAYKEFEIAFPMTCFCDLPLSQLHEHLNFYGGYGIGLKKEWGIDRKINPVLYMHQNSAFADYIGTLINVIKDAGNANKKAWQYMMNIMRHIKLYEGYVSIDDKTTYKRFYDEREWRWVPFLTDNDCDEVLSLTKEEFNTGDKRSKADFNLSKRSKLEFSPEDIKYIIVSSDNEIIELLNKIGSLESRYNENDTRLICTKIMCSDQIKTDF